MLSPVATDSPTDDSTVCAGQSPLSTVHPFDAMSDRTAPSTSRLWLAALLVTITHRLTELGCLRLPFIEERHAEESGTRDKRTRERITSTGIVILGLLEVIFAGFLVGCTHGSVHPVWKVIMGLAALGLVVSALRIRCLIKASGARRAEGDARIDGAEVWPAIPGAPRKAEA